MSVRLRAPGVDATISNEYRLRVRPPDEVDVLATFGTDLDRWTVELVTFQGVSEPFPFWVVPPRPVVGDVFVVDGGVRRNAYRVRLMGPAYAEETVAVVDGVEVPSEPVRSSDYDGALTIGLEALVPASSFRWGEAEVRVRTPGAAGGGVSDPATVTLPPLPLHSRPELWAGAMVGLVVLGLGLHRLTRAREDRESLEAEVAERTSDLEERTRALDAALATQEAQAGALREAADQRARAFAGVTHDLRTPLSVVVASLDCVLDRDAVGPVDRAEVEAARRAADHLARLSVALGEAARHEAGQFSISLGPVDVAEIARDLASEQRVLFDRLGVSVLVEADGETWAHADEWAVRRVLSNLLDNAGKFTPEGGAVTLSVTGEPAGEAVELVVQDTGRGFAPGFVRRAFEPYVQGEDEATGSPSRGGVGLGLSVVRDLVERMGGSVRAELGPGGRVVVALPADDKPVPTATESDPSDRRADRPLVLVAEDDLELRGVLVRLLGEEFEVETVADGRRALEAARRLRPDIVVSDVMMPEIDGVGLVRSLRAEPWGKSVPVVLVTALGAPEQAVGAFAAEADYVAKPFVRAARVRRLVG